MNLRNIIQVIEDIRVFFIISNYNFLKVYYKGEYDKVLKMLFKKNKNISSRQKEFIKLWNNLYNKANFKKYFSVSNTHLKNLYSAKKNGLNPTNISDIYIYSKDVNNSGEFLRLLEKNFNR